MLKTALYLIPVPLGDTPVEQVLPSYNREVIAGIRHFIVENVRSARRFLKKSNPDICIDDLTFYELNRHTEATEVSGFLEPLRRGYATGVISEAGWPIRGPMLWRSPNGNICLWFHWWDLRRY